jgi:hypothetical protein
LAASPRAGAGNEICYSLGAGITGKLQLLKLSRVCLKVSGLGCLSCGNANIRCSLLNDDAQEIACGGNGVCAVLFDISADRLTRGLRFHEAIGD